ncbi:alpha/beta hydrolase fold domain-containing protein [Actinomadura chibensis]|uniref:Alpha/beta hydrolase fold domain-containing protein n=1 Tax=Actinomadura chibensis TaxID=392828 RepID=A0A5D0NGD0_9ACTN|nr:alpha/beta hydrolase fold domain-containing protein [Actinomadura chibensis]TYB43460.1 alpha/beta hydrolase fold domain-containing protein [Actinomadura chibensis]
MPYVLLALGILVALAAANAHSPRRSVFLLVPSFFFGWLTIELAPHVLVLWAVATALTAVFGGLDGWAGWLGLGLAIAGMAGLGATLVAARRTVVTLRDCGAPLDLDPEGAPRYPLAHLVVPPLCLIPRRGVRVERNVVYRQDGRLRLKADVYRPAGEGELRPGLMQIHGGAWVIGDKREQGLPLLNHMAVQGWVGFNVNYRLSPRATWPEHLIDLKHFIAWYRQHAEEYGADPDFLCVTGGSAGGHLTAMVALTANVPEFQPGFEDVDTSVRGAVPFYGVYNLFEAGPWPRPMGATHLLERMVIKQPFAADPEAYAKASPVTYIREDAPPFFVIHGSRDSLIPVAEARRFVERLRDVSAAPVVYAEMKGAQHAFDVFPSYRTARVIEAVERYLTGLHRQGSGTEVPGEIVRALGDRSVG